jgi:hypothetical protein
MRFVHRRSTSTQTGTRMKPHQYIIIIPAVLGLVYMIFHEDLSLTGWILTGCVAFTVVMMYVQYKISEANLKEHTGQENNDKDKVDRAAFKVMFRYF